VVFVLAIKDWNYSINLGSTGLETDG